MNSSAIRSCKGRSIRRGSPHRGRHLDPQTVVLLALMLHELGTNSAKYGALSSSSGRVVVDWSVSDDLLHLQWVERGGPLVARPAMRGFGTVLIEQSVKSAGGGAEMLCETKGVTWKLHLKLPRFELQKDSHLFRPDQLKSERKEINARVVRSPALLKGARFLVVEDEPLIALQLVGSLETAGAERVRSVGTEEVTTLIACCSTPTCTVDRSTELPRPLRVTACRLSLLPVMDGRICSFRSGKHRPWTSPSARGNCSKQSRNCCQ